MYAQKRCKLDGIFEDTDFSSCSSEVAPQIEEILEVGSNKKAIDNAFFPQFLFFFIIVIKACLECYQ